MSDGVGVYLGRPIRAHLAGAAENENFCSL